MSKTDRPILRMSSVAGVRKESLTQYLTRRLSQEQAIPQGVPQDPSFLLEVREDPMQVKVYVPHTVEIPSEFLIPLAQRAHKSLSESARKGPATRGHLVRQAIRDGLLRDLDDLIGKDGEVDLFCDPHSEIPLEIENQTVTLLKLLETLQNRQSGSSDKNEDLGHQRGEIVPRRVAA